MKLKNNNVKIEITETKNGKICIDITTSKEVVVNVKNEKCKKNDRPILTGNRFGLVNIFTRKKLNKIADNNKSFDSHDIEKRNPKNNKE